MMELFKIHNLLTYAFCLTGLILVYLNGTELFIHWYSGIEYEDGGQVSKGELAYMYIKTTTIFLAVVLVLIGIYLRKA